MDRAARYSERFGAEATSAYRPAVNWPVRHPGPERRQPLEIRSFHYSYTYRQIFAESPSRILPGQRCVRRACNAPCASLRVSRLLPAYPLLTVPASFVQSSTLDLVLATNHIRRSCVAAEPSPARAYKPPHPTGPSHHRPSAVPHLRSALSALP